ncbi:hypothetical protein ABK040_009442 [Willaertia magna]
MSNSSMHFPLLLFLFFALLISYFHHHSPLVQQVNGQYFPADNVMIWAGGSSLSEEVHKECGQLFSIQNVEHNIQMTYNASGSGTGLKNLLNFTTNTFDYSGTDSIPSDGDYTNNPDLQLLPLMAGNVIIIHNIKGISLTNDPELILDRKTLVDIFSGRITNWNDQQIINLNPLLKNKLPAEPIIRVVRSDSSGTTELFTSAFEAFSKNSQTAESESKIIWTIGTTSLVTVWPNEVNKTIIKQKGSSGVSNYVYNNVNTIGYDTPSTVLKHKIVKLKNRFGKVVAPTVESCSSAIQDFQTSFDSRFTVSIVDGSGENSYPIAGYTYLAYKSASMENCKKAKVLYRYFKFLYQDKRSQSIMINAGFVPVSDLISTNIVNNYLFKWICRSKESAVTYEVDTTVIITLSIVGGIIAIIAMIIVLTVTSFARWRALKKRMAEEEDN